MDILEQLNAIKENYYSLFPDDPLVGYYEEHDHSAIYELSVFKWAIEYKKHWYEYPDLSRAYLKMPFSYSDWRNYQNESQH